MQILNSARFMYSSPLSRWIFSRSSSTKLFVGGLSYDTNETILKDAFGEYGEIIEGNTILKNVVKYMKVICDHVSGKSKGYGFVHFNSEAAASKALEEMNDKILDGRNIRIQLALSK